MTKQSWFIVFNISKQIPLWDKTLTVYEIGKKAEILAKQYQDELNDGLDMENCIKQDRDFISVCAIPWNQAREYVKQDIQEIIENAKEYIPKDRRTL